jgi:hypothetical protein
MATLARVAGTGYDGVLSRVKMSPWKGASRMDERLHRTWALLAECDLTELWVLQRWLAARIAAVEATTTPQAVAQARSAGQALARPPGRPVGPPALLHQYVESMRDAAGRGYVARAYGRSRDDGTWEGWLEFTPADGGPLLRTGQETTQPDREALAYWAGGLEPVYLDGALTRARRSTAE